MKFFFLILTAMLLSVAVKAQTTTQPSTLAQGNYNYLTLSKVDDVASVTTVSETQKVSLAEFFKQEETSIAQGVASGIGPAAMDQLKAQLTAQFQAILTTQQLAEYSLKRSSSYLARKDYTKSSMQLQPQH